jgi:hypothetical protein
MGRSFYSLRKDNLVEDFTRNNSYYHAASDMHYTMLERDGKYFLRRHQAGYLGAETNVQEKQIDFVVSSQNHARTYLHLTSWHSTRAGRLVFGRQRTLGNSPGYDRAVQSDSRHDRL